MSCHTRSKNGCKCYLESKGDFKSESYEEKKASKDSAILQIAHYNGNRNFIFENYYNLLARVGPVYTLTEDQKTSAFGNGPKDPIDINFSKIAKNERTKLPKTQQTINTYYNSM